SWQKEKKKKKKEKENEKEEEEEEEKKKKIVFTWIKWFNSYFQPLRDSKALWKATPYKVVHATPSIEMEGDNLPPVPTFLGERGGREGGRGKERWGWGAG
ncbi:putative F-box protein, partial [Ophiophagus hannah]